MKVFKQLLLNIFISIIVLINDVSSAQSFKDMVIDSTDSALDISGLLDSDLSFLPVPIIITEPALGFGGGLLLSYFHKGKVFENDGPKGHAPTISFVGGAYTTNGTWMALGGHQGSYLNDRIRYLGIIGYVSPNLTFYGGGFDMLNGEYKFNMKGFLIMQEILYKIKKNTPFFMGLNYLYFNNAITFKTGIDIPELEKLTFKTNTAGMNAVFLWDSRNNSLSPTKGVMSTLEIGSYSKKLGGDNDYGNIETRNYFYAPIVTNKVYSGYRLSVAHKWGDVPFYELPFISLRGIPALRYQNNNVYTVETEWRYNFITRWSLVGFVGVGEALKNYGDIFKDIKVAGGGGFRYLLAKKYGLQAGIDIARGPEIWAWNLTIGSNWVR